MADHRWSGLTAVCKVVRVREMTDKTTTETAYYLLSTAMAAERFGEVVRSHWAVENRLHWCLDVTMNEEQARNRMDHSPQNLGILRHMALNLVRKESSRDRCEKSSGGPPGATPSWPRCWLNFEMRLPCRASSRVDVASRYTRQTRGLP
jgi:predicted transposase YbfD/YdcC